MMTRLLSSLGAFGASYALFSYFGGGALPYAIAAAFLAPLLSFALSRLPDRHHLPLLALLALLLLSLPLLLQSHNHIHFSTPLSSLHQTHTLLHTRDDDSTSSHSPFPLQSHTQSSLLHSHTPSQFGTTHHSSTLHIATLFHSSHQTPFLFLLSSSTPHHQNHLCKPLHFPQPPTPIHSCNSQYNDAPFHPTDSNLHSSMPFLSHTLRIHLFELHSLLSNSTERFPCRTTNIVRSSFP